ncbi:hypothetical protein [Actinomadura hibisca]|uniref:hypothetical protein n=1 Tax=Actinomadura hibisca TaxID=68565 RepID=UPI00082F5AF5|nr:hypothetical protein [Actinomadura hibisca]
MSPRTTTAYAAGFVGCAAMGYAVHVLLSSTGCVGSCGDAERHVALVPTGLFLAIAAAFFGARLVFPGIFLFLGVGAVTVTGQGVAPVLLGASLLAVGLLIVAVGLLSGRAARRAARRRSVLASEGSGAVATVLGVQDTGVRVNGRRRVVLRVRIEPVDGHPAFEADKTLLTRPDAPFRPGQRHPALYFPDRPEEFGLVTGVGDRSALPAGLRQAVDRLDREGEAPR